VQKAREEATEAIRIDPYQAGAYLTLSFLALDDGDWIEAVRNAHTAINLDPLNPAYYSARGFAYSSNEQFDLAIEDFEKALELDPENVDAVINMAANYVVAGDYETAIDYYEQALAMTDDLDLIAELEDKLAVISRVPPAVNGLRTLAEESLGFTVSYPEDWFLEPLDLETGVQTITIPTDDGLAFVGVGVGLDDSFPNPLALAVQVDAILQLDPSYELISLESATLNGVPVAVHEFELTPPLGDPVDRIRARQYYLMQGDRFAIISYQAEPEMFEEYEALFNELLESFTFLP
jgi:tetratricopeptide (TPR) repeat protein